RRRAAGNGTPAVEAGSVVGRCRTIVVAAICIDRADAPNREARAIERPEDRRRLRGDARIDDELAEVAPAVEADVAQPDSAKPRRGDRAAGLPRIGKIGGGDA